MIVKYLTAIYQSEPVLCNGAVAALVAPVVDAAGISVPVEVLAGYVAIVLGAALHTRSRVIPAYKPVEDLGNLESKSK